jgi:type VI secretion system secreted protein VgrG
VAYAAPVQFTLRAGSLSEAELAVTRVDGRERLSEPYLFVVDATHAQGEPIDLAAMLGGEATLWMRRAGLDERVVHGEVHVAELVGIAAGKPRYRLTIRPKLARLALGARSRVFQEKTAPEIVKAVLDERGIAHRLHLAGKYPKREMTIQHRESDLAFVSRLLEAEGIWYRFEHAEDRHELVLADAKGAYAHGDSVPYRPEGELGSAGHVSRIQRTSRLVTGTTASRDYDFERPMLEVSGKAQEGGAPEVYEWPGGYRAPAEGKRLARTRLEELRHGAETWEGQGTSLVPAPGVAFGLDEHPELLTVGVVHRGSQERSATGEVKLGYENTFEAIDADRPYRPRRRTPCPRIGGIQTATVVVPSGEEIHTEHHERVKVRFRWDREGKEDDGASAWVRLAQPWAGAGMGAAFVPRVGQEVVIRFLDGDPDRPLVVGAVYNGTNVPPLELPHQKTRSTLRTATTPGSDGYNELRFEDEAGREEIHLHAQKDREVEVRAEEERVVRGNAALSVEDDRTKRVLGSQRLDLARDDARAVGASETTTVALARDVTVAGTHEERVGAVQTVTVGGAQDVTVANASAVTVGAAAALNVGAGYFVNVGGAVNHLVVGLKATEVAGASVELVGAHREERVVGEKTVSVGADAVGDVDGAVRMATDKDLSETVSGRVTILVADGAQTEPQQATLEATGSLKLVVGDKVVLAMTSGGEVQLAGTNLTLDGSEIAAKGGTLKKIQPGGIQGAQVAAAALAPGEDAWIDLALEDEDGNPAGDEDYEIRFSDGTTVSGRFGSDGRARVRRASRGPYRVRFPGFGEARQP